MKIALIGYGEVGRILAEDLRSAGHAVSAYDLKLASAPGDGMRTHARAHGVTLAGSHSDAARDCELAFSAVTASQTAMAAEASAGALPAGSFYLDLNSASPGEKLRAAGFVAAAGGRYVEGAVMASVPPHRLAVPLLLGGPDAEALEPILRRLGFAARTASARLGVASATKLCRSVVIKGLEAMLIESLLAARHYGVEAAVLDSLRETFPGIEWERQAAYFFQRVIEHGRRRSEEMEEAASTVRQAGLSAWSAEGTAQRQAWMAGLADSGLFGPREAEDFVRASDWRVEADRILNGLRRGKA